LSDIFDEADTFDRIKRLLALQTTTLDWLAGFEKG
jgi:hypothetical protein